MKPIGAQKSESREKQVTNEENWRLKKMWAKKNSSSMEPI
jgi:hypothetical protein